MEQRLLFSADAPVPIDPDSAAPGDDPHAPIELVVSEEASVTAADEPTVRADPTALPLAFEENRGQSDSQVDFLARGSGYGVYLTGGDAVLDLRAGEAGHVVRLDLVGADESPEASGTRPLASESHHLGGSGADQTHVEHWAGVRYDDVYEGVDVVYCGRGRQLEYDFVVEPGADAGQIALRFDGVAGVRIGENGDLVLSRSRPTTEARPRS